MNEATLDETNFAMNSQNEDAKLLVKFHIAPIPNQAKTETEGRPIYDDTEMIRIMVPGDKDNIVDRPATPFDKQRFAQHYARFKQGLEEQSSGTPLEAWPLISRAQVEELRYFNIRTVEQVAELRDDLVSKLHTGRMLKDKAKVFIEAAKADAPVQKMAAELAERDRQIAELRKGLEAANAKISAMEVKK